MSIITDILKFLGLVEPSPDDGQASPRVLVKIVDSVALNLVQGDTLTLDQLAAKAGAAGTPAVETIRGIIPEITFARTFDSLTPAEIQTLVTAATTEDPTYQAFMGAQAAACLFLLIGAGLLIRGSIRSIVLCPGFATKHVVSLEITFPSGLGYTHAKQLADVQQLFRRIKNLPDVHAVSAGIAPDAGGLRTAAVGLNGHKPSTDKTREPFFIRTLHPATSAVSAFRSWPAIRFPSRLAPRRNQV